MVTRVHDMKCMHLIHLQAAEFALFVEEGGCCRAVTGHKCCQAHQHLYRADKWSKRLTARVYHERSAFDDGTLDASHLDRNFCDRPYYVLLTSLLLRYTALLTQSQCHT